MTSRAEFNRPIRSYYPLGLVLFALCLAFYKAGSLITAMGADWFLLLTFVGLPLGLVLFALCLAFYKAGSLITAMGADWFVFLTFVGLDSFFLAVFFMLAYLQGISKPKWLRSIIGLVLIFLTVFYLIDSFVLLALDEHASLFEIARFTLEWAVVLSFMDTGIYITVLLLLFSILVFLRSTPAVRKFGLGLFMVAFLSAGYSAVSAPLPLKSYAFLSPSELLEGIGPEQVLESYSAQEIAFYAGLNSEAVAIPDAKPNIILLIVESLSSINSEKVSGQPGFLGGFDELANEGVLFQNFFANHQASEGGLIALLGGFPPMHFPTASPYMFDEFGVQASVIAEYRQQGYVTEFLTNADLTFIGLDHFLAGLGFDSKRGRDEVNEMRVAPRVVLDSPSDTYLYREALLSIRRLMSSDQAFLLTIATTSTHLPYTHPEGGADTPEAVWEWSMEQLLSFYSQLSESGFFEHGILLITGDHRQMRPVSTAEIDRYGPSARARVPLLVIGDVYPAGSIDKRFFQQSDLLRMLGEIDEPETRLSPYPIWVERYNRKYGRIELINSLSVFDEADQGRHEYKIKVPGNHIEWLVDKPEFARQLETRIHKQRSLHQQARTTLSDQAAENR